MFLENNILVPDWKKSFNNLVCGFTLPYYGNMALTRKSISFSRTLIENRKILSNNLNIKSDSIFSPHQIHSDVVIYVDKKSYGKGAFSLEDAIEGDACFTDIKNNLMLVTWADCIPIILYESNKNIVAAVHSGWRGTKTNIVSKTIDEIIRIGGERDYIFASIGPGIRDCCYQIGNEVADFFNIPLYSEFLKKKSNEYYLDLQSVVYKQLIMSAIPKANIDSFGFCNSCSTAPSFFSCRKDGKEHFEGQAAFIGIYK